MSRAREFADLAGSADAGGLTGRNLIINGAMQVAQRGTSSTSSGYGSVDRFSVEYGGGTITQSQETLTSGTPYEKGFRKFLRATATSAGSNAAADFCYLVQYVEAQNVADSGWNYTSSSSYVTIQFWVRSSLAGTYYCVFKSIDGTARAFITPVVLAANTWTKITQSISGDSNVQFDNNTDAGLEISIRPYVGTNYTDPSVNTTTWYTRSGSTQTPDYLQNWQSTGSATFDITGVQLEVGETATPFEHRSYADELARCQRYYAKSYSDGVAAGTVTSVGAIMVYSPATGNTMRYTLHYPQQMRATPTFTPYNPETGTSGYGAFEGQGTTNQEVVGYTFNGNKSALLFNTNMNLTGSFYWQWSLDAEL